ncbi:MAG: GNAT family N-acetyltransferase [Patescibacteria group bacterium]
MIAIKRILPGVHINLGEVNRLLGQQSPGNPNRNINPDELNGVLCDPLYVMLAAVDADMAGHEHWRGMATIFFQRNLTRWMAEIHDVVVDEPFRGQGIGERLTCELMDIALEFCQKRNIKLKLSLISRPSRKAANGLYVKLGFVLVAKADGEWGTNLYKIIVEPHGFRGLP